MCQLQLFCFLRVELWGKMSTKSYEMKVQGQNNSNFGLVKMFYFFTAGRKNGLSTHITCVGKQNWFNFFRINKIPHHRGQFQSSLCKNKALNNLNHLLGKIETSNAQIFKEYPLCPHISAFSRYCNYKFHLFCHVM